MTNESIIRKTEVYVQEKFQGESSGHDWWHIYRVWQMAKHIGKNEKADMFTVELGALLHDIADFKFHSGNTEIGPQTAQKWLESLDVNAKVINDVCAIVRDISYKGARVQTDMKTLEGKIVQDADRLDALGAIGIARTFAYGGYKNREMYNPDIKPVLHETFESYKNAKGTTINHFYEKLLLLKERMNTNTGKKIAEKRTNYMEDYLKQFFKDWEGNIS